MARIKLKYVLDKGATDFFLTFDGRGVAFNLRDGAWHADIVRQDKPSYEYYYVLRGPKGGSVKLEIAFSGGAFREMLSDTIPSDRGSTGGFGVVP